ncbi:MAG: precorrin-6y C5,15-methyltransferase (decarboxylating) subunit CbiE, partial [Oscillospiraceae bacterium]|nr:precorrin-6y C5,15-methyltransferase (decarboxylating) subunit CbiE [Oscillospiraceae bacterium]
LEGNILLTTGSKELDKFTGIRDFSERVYARVLPMESSLEACSKAGLSPSHIIAMQGPFSFDMNVATLKAINASCLVTKDSGGAGGFEEKAEAAKAAGARLVIIGRPPQVEGLGFNEAVKFLREKYGLERKASVTVVGIGPGSPEGMTIEAKNAIKNADCLIGAKRMTDSAAPGKKAFNAISPEDIAGIIREHGEYRRFAVLMSGDTGFYSGTKKLLPLLSDYSAEVLPGISSLSCLCSKIGRSYEDVLTVSLHGRDRDIVPYVKKHRRVFTLTGGKDGMAALCRRLTEAGLGDVTLYVGQRLSYPDEEITAGKARELSEREFSSLSVALIENPDPDFTVTGGLPDEAFERVESVPMTKSEVRAVCLSKLQLKADSVCWDVGAGTGSVSVEMARLAGNGHVFAVEKNEKAVEALNKNRERFALDNLTVTEGAAPDACRPLPAPDRVFIGGSGGKAGEIIKLALSKNPKARIVATAITLETVAEMTALSKDMGFTGTEVVSLTAARDRKAGPYRLMTGQNPVYIFTMTFEDNGI